MMRDKIVKVMIARDNAFHMAHRRQATNLEKASAIVAALPDMIPDLVWTGPCADAGNGCYYQMLESQSGRSFQLTFIFRNGSHSLGYPKTADHAKAAANEHHKVAVMAALGVSS